MKATKNQKLVRYSLFLFFSIFIFCTAQAQSIPLPQNVKFKIGDNMDWANPSFNDKDWGYKQLGTILKDDEVKDNIYAWYRIKIVIPSSLKALSEKGKSIKLNLGKIDDADQTFFNGKLIGQTGSMPPQFISKWEKERVYTIPVNDILWDKENVIAVRVFSNIGGAGMYIGSYTCAPIQWSDSISVNHSITETGHNGFITKVKFTNHSNYIFNGTVKYWINDMNNKELFTESKAVQVLPEKNSENEVVFSNYQPANEQIFKVGYQITENNCSDTVRNEQVYLANKQIAIKVANEPKVIVQNKVQDVFSSIPFQNQILKGYIGDRFTRNLEERLLKVDEDGLMNPYLQRPGVHPWAGEHVGKYLEAACNVWKVTHDKRLKEQMDRMMYELINSQLGNGYLGTYTPDQYWTSWDVWSHVYNLYGLLAYYTTTGYKPALEACIKMGDLLCTTFGNKPGQRDIILAGTHVGMAATSVLDPMVELYKYTGEKKYLDFCYYIMGAWEQDNGPKIISSLLSTGKVTKVGDGKAYEMLSNLVGLTNLYRLTGDEKLLKPVLIAWKDIVANRLYITGTTSSFEHFQASEMLPAGNESNMGEGCVSVTWIQFNHDLFAITGDLKYMDQIEKTIYNHLLGAENPETGCVSYYTPLMGNKPYNCGITCCTSSVPRGIAWVPYFTFGNVNNVPTLLLYEPATYKETITTSDKKMLDLSLKVENNFPINSETVITLDASMAATYSLSFRVPSWCESFVAKVGNKSYKGSPNQYLIINKDWKPADKIIITFKMPIKTLDGGKSYPNQTALQRGPQILAFDESLNTSYLNNQINHKRRVAIKTNNYQLITDSLPSEWLGKQVYSFKLNDKKQSLILVPYADAGQTGGTVKVWLPLNLNK